ncbi:MAG: type IV pilus modification protein PilV [Cellvibrionaceae bacterium]
MPLNSHSFKRQRKSQAGIGLIEILISLLVLSVGLLGLASMQANGLKHNRNAYFRTQATILAYDIADRMRANSTQAETGAYVESYGAASGSACSSNCTPAQISATDLIQWKANLANQLPSGDGKVEDNGSNNFDITIKWSDGDNNTPELTLGVQL